VTDKTVLRAELLKKREKMDQGEIDAISSAIFQKVALLEAYKKAKCVMAYVTFGKELNTIPFLRQCFQDEKRTVTPICHKDRTMTLALTTAYPEGFKKNKYGIMELDEREAVGVPVEEVDLVIVPGLAFTLDGDRLGYGGGYYDRLFEKLAPGAVKLCPSFDSFIVGELPVDEHDKKVDVILTENRSVFIRRNP
jgi:5-formyltetrahydrofolate cyclo-ligase